MQALAQTLVVTEAFKKLLETKWRPRRSLVFALWDGEEGDLVGSTEWVEDHLSLLRNGAVLYVAHDIVTGGSRRMKSCARDAAIQAMMAWLP